MVMCLSCRFFFLNEVLSITAQECALSGSTYPLPSVLNEVLSITAQESSSFAPRNTHPSSSMKS